MTAQGLMAPTCQGCSLATVCRDRKLACAVFARWVETGRTSTAKREANRAMYERVFEAEAA